MKSRLLLLLMLFTLSTSGIQAADSSEEVPEEDATVEDSGSTSEPESPDSSGSGEEEEEPDCE